MVTTEKILLLFSGDRPAVVWEEIFQGVGLSEFCLAFNSSQAVMLLKSFSDIKAVIGETALLDREKPDVSQADRELFKVLDARVAQMLVLAVSENTAKRPVQKQVLGHIQSQRPKRSKKQIEPW